MNHETIDPSHEIKQEEKHRHQTMQEHERRLYNSRIGQGKEFTQLQHFILDYKKNVSVYDSKHMVYINI